MRNPKNPKTDNTDVLRPTGPPIGSTCSPERLGQTFASLNLANIEDPDRRAKAFMDALTGLMIQTATDRDVRAELVSARLEAARRGRND